MSLFYLMMVPLAVLGGLWLTFRSHPVEPRGRILTLIMGLGIAALALYQGLQGHTPFAARQSIVPSSAPGALSPSATGALLHAVALFLIVMVATAGASILCVTQMALKERDWGVLRTRGTAILRYGLCIGAYFYAALLPMSLVKRDLLHLTDRTAYEVTVAYVSLIAVAIFIATILAFDAAVRRRKAIVTAFLLGCVLIAGSSPFVWAVVAATTPAAQPLGLLSIFAMVAPAPIYFLLHYRLGWL